VCICGRPNVGKSSLLNCLLGHERAIVTPVPGTTRDVVEESLNLNGLPVILWDTAGIRDTNDQVERIGVELSRQHLEQADVAIVVFDGSEPMAAEDIDILKSVREKKHILAINKNDLAQRLAVGEVASPDKASVICLLSAKSGVGIEALKSKLRDLILDYKIEPTVAVTNIRHRSQLVRSAESLAAAVATLAQGLPPELAAVDLSEAGKALGEIIGLVTNETILERIFSIYCIGK
jgi:tRNA modification GTPase